MFKVFVLFLACVSGLQLQPMTLRSASTPVRVPAAPQCQFGSPEKDGLTRDSEPDEYFATNMGVQPHQSKEPLHSASSTAWSRVADKMSDAEKLKSPVIFGGVAIIVLPFVIGMIALFASK